MRKNKLLQRNNFDMQRQNEDDDLQMNIKLKSQANLCYILFPYQSKNATSKLGKSFLSSKTFLMSISTTKIEKFNKDSGIE